MIYHDVDQIVMCFSSGICVLGVSSITTTQPTSLLSGHLEKHRFSPALAFLLFMLF